MGLIHTRTEDGENMAGQCTISRHIELGYDHIRDAFSGFDVRSQLWSTVLLARRNTVVGKDH